MFTAMVLMLVISVVTTTVMFVWSAKAPKLTGRDPVWRLIWAFIIITSPVMVYSAGSSILHGTSLPFLWGLLPFLGGGLLLLCWICVELVRVVLMLRNGEKPKRKQKNGESDEAQKQEQDGEIVWIDFDDASKKNQSQ